MELVHFSCATVTQGPYNTFSIVSSCALEIITAFRVIGDQFSYFFCVD